MGKLELFEIKFEHPHAVFKAGDRVLGHVIVQLSEPFKMRNIRLWFQGRAKVHWTRSSGSGSNRSTKHYRAEELYFDDTSILFGSTRGEDSLHPAGYHQYPFQINLAASLPSSFEGQYGYVRYISKATIDRPWKFDYDVKAAFTVMSLLDLNLEPGNIRTPMEGSETKEITCCCCSEGTVTCTFRINKTGFVPGENMMIYAEIVNNSSNTIVSTKVNMKQYIEFYGRHESLFGSGDLKAKCDTDIVATTVQGTIAAGETGYWNNVPMRVPPIPPSRLVGCDIINMSYVIKFYIGEGEDIKLVTDIVIGTIPLRETYRPQNQTQYAMPLPAPSIFDVDAPQLFPDEPPREEQIEFELPPPSYEECVKGHRQIKDDTDSQYTRGQLEWAPSYPTYNFPDAANAFPPATAPVITEQPSPYNDLPYPTQSIGNNLNRDESVEIEEARV